MSASSTPYWMGLVGGLVGVFVGFILGEGSRYLRYRLDIIRNQRIVKSELKSILAQIPQKRDILQQASAHLREKRILPLQSVRIVSIGYYSVLENLYPHLTELERNCLHVIFERLRVAEEEFDGFEESFQRAFREKILEDPWTAFSARLNDLLNSYSVVETLAHSYLAGRPDDVFQLGQGNHS